MYRVKEKEGWGTYGRLTYTYFHSINQKDGEKGAVGVDEKNFWTKNMLGWEWKHLSLNLRWTQKPPAPHRRTGNVKTRALTKLHKHALVFPFVILFPLSLSLTNTHTLSFSLSLDALGSVSPSEICHSLSDIPGSPDSPPLLHSPHCSVSPWNRPLFSQRYLCLGNILVP